MDEYAIRGEEGEVVSIHGGRATVMIKANKGCEGCNLCTRASETEMVVEAVMRKPVKVGQKVTVAVKPGTIVKAAFILYMFPVIGLIGGYYVGKYLQTLLNLSQKTELVPALFALFFLIACFLPIRLLEKRKKKDSSFDVFISG